MGREIVAAVAVALAEHVSRDQACNARVEVDDRAAGKIENAGAGEKAAAPHPMRDRHVDEQQPARDEPQRSDDDRNEADMRQARADLEMIDAKWKAGSGAEVFHRKRDSTAKQRTRSRRAALHRQRWRGPTRTQ